MSAPSDRDSTPRPSESAGFAILCLGRTGSKHLVSLLDSHPSIRCFGEVLNMRHPEAARGPWFGDSDGDDPVAFARSILGSEPERSVGFKLPRNALEEHPAIAEWLRSDRELPLVRLVRSDPLAILVSRRLLMASLVSQTTSGEYDRKTVRIDPEECVRALERIVADDRALDELASGHPTFRIEYGELARGERLDELQRFLGVEPAGLSSPYERRRRRPLAETVENWEQLRERLRETAFAELVDRA